jgi:YfiH family protein
MSTRHGPEGDAFDLRLPEDGTGVAGTRRRAHLLAAVGLEGARLVEVRQVHGASVVDAREVAPADEADAIVIRDDGLVAGIRVADCVPVLLADRRGRAAAAVHAGWRGVAAGIVPAAIERLARSGVPPADVIAGVGPSIGRCCYQVDRECAAAVAAAAPPDPGGPATVVETPEGPHLDLPAAVRSQLLAAGVAGERVVCAPWCTRCSPALLFSHRGGGPLAGRLLAVIGLGSYGRCP